MVGLLGITIMKKLIVCRSVLLIELAGAKILLAQRPYGSSISGHTCLSSALAAARSLALSLYCFQNLAWYLFPQGFYSIGVPGR